MIDWAELRAPLRAAVAATLSLGLGDLLHRQRPYWAVLVAVALVGGASLGDTLRSTGTRLIMTALGCAVALALEAVIGQGEVRHVALMLVSVLLAIFFRGYSQPGMIFFLTVYVVFLFGVLGVSGQGIALLRVYQTAVGCAVALAATLLVPASRALQAWRGRMQEFLTAMVEHSGAAFHVLLDESRAEESGAPRAGRRTQQQLEDLWAQYRTARYEHLLQPRRNRELMRTAVRLGRGVLGLLEAAERRRGRAVARLLGAELGELRDQVAAAFSLSLEFQDEIGAAAARCAERAQALLAQGLLTRDDVESLGPVLYYSARIGAELAAVRRLFTPA